MTERKAKPASDRDAVIVAAVRTAVGKAHKGKLAGVRAEDLGKAVVEGVLQKVDQVLVEQIDDVIFGCAMPEGEQGLNVARIISLYAGLAVTTPAITVNRFCASGLQAIAYAAERIKLGEADIIIAGGVESMSHVPMTGFRLSPHPTLVEQMPEVYMGMGHTAEEVARQYSVSRQAQDAYAANSHRKAAQAIADGKFIDEIVAIETTTFSSSEAGRPQSSPTVFKQDEGVRIDTDEQILATLQPAFARNGTVTAGNSSQMSDGAACVLVMSRQKAKELQLQPLATLRGYQVTGVAPEVMGIGPIAAIPKVLQKAGLTTADIDLYEINEAFAAQVIPIINKLSLEEEKVNVNGGAIALGHPLGCTGAKLTVSLIHELRRRGGGLGVVSMCIGGGMGAAAVLEVHG